MREFDYIIIGGGCAGLSLAYELETNQKLKDKSLAIIEPREEYKRDKTWSFWKVINHNFEDCVKKVGIILQLIFQEIQNILNVIIRRIKQLIAACFIQK